MLRAFMFALLAVGTAHGQLTLTQFIATPEPQKVTYIAVMKVMVPDYTRSYAVVCAPEHPDCNTVYKLEYRYIPFESAKDALDYLNATEDSFVRLLTVQTAPVVAKETTTKIIHPPTEEKSVHYSLK